MNVKLYDLFPHNFHQASRTYLDCDVSDSEPVTVEELLRSHNVTPSKEFMVIVNGKPNRLDYVLQENDKIHYILLVGGG